MKRQHEDTTAPAAAPQHCPLPESSTISETHKRQKGEEQAELSSNHDLCAPITIQELKSLKQGRIFHGDVLVIYKTIVDRVHGIELLRADIVDTKGNMAITLNVPHNLIPTAEQKLVVGQGICIKDFKVSPKTVYDHSDCNWILVLHEKSIIETIPAVCTEYRFVPTTTIRQLRNTTGFGIGTVVGLVTSAKEIDSQYVLNIKDGQCQQDTASVYLFDTFKPIFKLVQQQISKKEAPMLLFRNVVRGPHASLRTCRSTFITAVKSDRVLADLSKLAMATTKVKGMLTIADIHADPFVIICNNCSVPADTFGTVSGDQLNCSTCQELTTYQRSLQLHCVIQTEGTVQHKCILKGNLLLELCPSLTGLTYEKYLEDCTDVTYSLRDFHVHSSFLLDSSDVIVRRE